MHKIGKSMKLTLAQTTKHPCHPSVFLRNLFFEAWRPGTAPPPPHPHPHPPR
jgi:hypothetical protein